MRQYSKKEIKKLSKKPEYCPFMGKINFTGKPPKVVQCPKCKRRLEPHMSTCTGGREDAGFACCIRLILKKHRMKK